MCLPLLRDIHSRLSIVVAASRCLSFFWIIPTFERVFSNVFFQSRLGERKKKHDGTVDKTSSSFTREQDSGLVPVPVPFTPLRSTQFQLIWFPGDNVAVYLGVFKGGEGSTSHCCFKLLLQNNLWKEIDSAKLLKVNRSRHIRGFTKITGQARDGDFPRFELKIKQLVKTVV